MRWSNKSLSVRREEMFTLLKKETHVGFTLLWHLHTLIAQTYTVTRARRRASWDWTKINLPFYVNKQTYGKPCRTLRNRNTQEPQSVPPPSLCAAALTLWAEWDLCEKTCSPHARNSLQTRAPLCWGRASSAFQACHRRGESCCCGSASVSGFQPRSPELWWCPAEMLRQRYTKADVWFEIVCQL